MSVEQIANPTFPLSDTQSSHVENTAASICVTEFHYRSGTTAVKRSAECNPADSAMGDTASQLDGQMVMKGGFEMMLLDGRHRCTAVHQFPAGGGR